MSPKGPTSIFLIFCNTLDFQKAKMAPFTILKTLRVLSVTGLNQKVRTLKQLINLTYE